MNRRPIVSEEGQLMECWEILAIMDELKLAGMHAASDEVVATGSSVSSAADRQQSGQGVDCVEGGALDQCERPMGPKRKL
jgi:hypothetical protein